MTVFRLAMETTSNSLVNAWMSEIGDEHGFVQTFQKIIQERPIIELSGVHQVRRALKNDPNLVYLWDEFLLREVMVATTICV